MNILVVKTSSMGDVVHALPAITDIARHVPGATIDWLVERPFAAIPELHPNVQRVIPMQLRKWRKKPFAAETRAAFQATLAALRATRYDLIIDFQGLMKSMAFCRLARNGHKETLIAGYDASSIMHEPYATLGYHRKAPVPRDMQAVERNRRLAAAHLGYALDGAPDFGIVAHLAQRPAWLPAGEYAVQMPAASRPEKLWPEEHWGRVGQTLAAQGVKPVVLWGGPEEEVRARSVAALCDGIVPPFLTVKDAAGLLAGARVVVGLDTGFTHLAAALAVPAIGIYCDHSPAHAGVTGSRYTASLGGKGTPPSCDAVLEALRDAMADGDVRAIAR